MRFIKHILITTVALLIVSGFSNADTYKKVEITADKLNVRNEMTTESKIVGKLEMGTVVEISEENEGWYTINYNNQVSYISSDFAVVVSDFKEGTITGRQVNLRSTPNVETGVIIKKLDYEKINVNSKEDDWYYVTDSTGNNGYVYADFISFNTQEEQQVVSRSDERSDLIGIAKSKLGSPYKWGADGPNSFDCSGFILYSFKEAYGINLGHSSKAMSKMGTDVSKANLLPGDLVFFTTDRSGNVNHVGIYIGGGEFIHASSSSYNGKQVAISSLDTGFYNEVYKWGKRVSIND